MKDALPTELQCRGRSRGLSYLNFKELGPEELPLPGAGQEDPDAVVTTLALQRVPLLQQADLQRVPVLGVPVPDREEPLEGFGDDVFRIARN